MSEAEHRAWLEEILWRPSPVAGLEVSADTSAAEWIGSHLVTTPHPLPGLAQGYSTRSHSATGRPHWLAQLGVTPLSEHLLYFSDIKLLISDHLTRQFLQGNASSLGHLQELPV
jgi:hypothetical protein